jgi:CRISPR system Cascade subunit CasE
MSVDAQKLYAFARASSLPSRDFDEGYAMHALLSALFDPGSPPPEERVGPKPFRILDPSRRKLDVWGYAKVDHAALADRARSFSDPKAWDACSLDELSSRRIPAFEAGRKVGFAVRVCPVRRVAKRGNQRDDRAEVDAFLAKAWEVGDGVPLSREDVYTDWLREELVKEGAAKLVSSRLLSFQLGRQTRRTQPGDDGARTSRRVAHPEALFEGNLEVVDPSAFHTRLARGLGRHRSFGFGMLLLRPPSA